MKYLTNRAAIGSAIIAILLACALFIFPALEIATAANTHSIDLESGSSQYLSAADSASLSQTGDMTIEWWMKLETHPQPIVFSKWNHAGGDQRSFYMVLATSDIGMKTSSNGTNIFTGTGASYSWQTGVWTHVAMAYDASAGTAEFFVNGSSIGVTTGLSTSIYDGTSTFEIGRYGETGAQSNYFDGLIDDVRVWNYARTEQEISDDKDIELNGNESGLVAYWKLNNGLTDATGNGNTLSANGGASHSADTPFSVASTELKAYKTVNESVTSSTVLQNDNDIKLTLDTNTTYLIDGVILASSTNATPDIVFSLNGQTGFDVNVGYTTDEAQNNQVILASGATSTRIQLPANQPNSIHIHGTVKTSSTSGDLQLKWAQFSSNGAATTVMKGSYLRAEAI